MKKVVLNKKLQLNKETIVKVNADEMTNIKGGNYWSGGCTDGCGSGFFQTEWNCTNSQCTNDCNCN